MGNGEVGLDGHVEPDVGLRQLNNGVVGLELGHVVHDLQEGWVLPVHQERRAVQRPSEETVDDGDSGLFSDGCAVTYGLGDVRDQVGGLVVARISVIPAGGSWGRCSIGIR